jgi:hypothetical protein
VGPFNRLKYSDQKKEGRKLCFKKASKEGEIKIYVGKKLKKHLSIAKQRHITEDKAEQLKAII